VTIDKRDESCPFYSFDNPITVIIDSSDAVLCCWQDYTPRGNGQHHKAFGCLSF